ncbi:MAG TPA: polysaccharide deacetylase family protein [Bacteroidota bacterium]|nr:polysaccharide deacetylase family protein [Bacteroidota bacterium]
MKLRVGLVIPSLWWEQILAQEGIPFGYADLNRLDEEWSVLVVSRRLEETEQRQIEEYLAVGGAVLGFAGYLENVCKTRTRTEPLEYIISEGKSPFADVHLLDLGLEGAVPHEANCLRTQQNTFAAFVGPMGGGYAVLLPFDPSEMMSDERAANKSFYFVRDRLPSERVSLVSKGEVQRVVHRSLEYLHHVRGLPYVHLWYFPEERPTIFAFRIDSDRGSREEVDALYRLARKHDIPMTWFLDVKSHEAWLHHFAYLSGQEFGVHCYDHTVFNTYEANLANIQKARQKLHRVGISSPGFAAPFGLWNPELARAIVQAGFEYSSEFSYAYDAFPLYPRAGTEGFTTIQIPIHPVCIGSMKRVGYTETHMADYFKRIMDEKLQRHEGWLFYHHPTHRSWDVVEFIFSYVRQKGIDCIPMSEYARWWKKRLKVMPGFDLEKNTLRMNIAHPEPSVWVRIVRPDMRAVLVPPFDVVDLEAMNWLPPQTVALPPSDIHRIREFDPRKLVGDLFTSLSRKFSDNRTG